MAYLDFREMAKSVGEYIDIIVGGHSHSLLWNTLEAPSKEVISGPYPVVMGSHSNAKHKVSLHNVISDIHNLIYSNHRLTIVRSLSRELQTYKSINNAIFF